MSRKKKQTMMTACAAIGFALLVVAAPSVVEAKPWSRENFFGIDKAGMEYFMLTLRTTGGSRRGTVYFDGSGAGLETPYLGRRHTGGATWFSGELTFETFRVIRKNGPYQGTLFIEVEKRGHEWSGNFFDIDGTTTGELVLNQDYAKAPLGHRVVRVCRTSLSRYFCSDRPDDGAAHLVVV